MSIKYLDKALMNGDLKAAEELKKLAEHDRTLQVEISTRLLKDLRNPYEQNPLMVAFERKHTEALNYLLNIPGLNIHLQDEFGYTLLMRAVHEGSLDLVKTLCTKTDKSYFNQEYNDSNALGIAINEGKYDIANFLFKQGTEVKSHGKNASMVLLDAVNNENLALVKLLLENLDTEAINSKNSLGQSALSLAVSLGNFEIFELLIHKKGIDVNTNDGAHFTPLMVATYFGHTEMVKKLLETKGIDATQRLPTGETAIDLAVHHKRSNLVELFKSYGFERSIPIDQHTLTEKCILYLSKMKELNELKWKKMAEQKDLTERKNLSEKAHSTHYHQEDIDKIIDDFDAGQCSGLSALWLESKFKNQASRFFGIQKLISTWNETSDKLLDEEGHPTFIANIFEQFISDIRWVQGESAQLFDRKANRHLLQTDFLETFRAIRHSPLDSELVTEFEFSFIVDSAEFTELLENIVLENKKIWVGGENHAVAIIKQANKFYAYDSNPPAGEFSFNSLSELQNFLENRLFKSFNYPTYNMSISAYVLDEAPDVSRTTAAQPQKYPYKMNEVELIDSFLKRKPDVNRNTINNNSPLHVACRDGLLEVIRTLLKKDNIEVNTENEESRTPLTLAAEYGHLEIVKLLVRRPEIDIHTLWQAMMVAAGNGYHSIVNVLKNTLANTRALESETIQFFVDEPWVNLMLRMCNGDVSAVSECLKSGIDINKQDPNGFTMLMWATFHEQTQVIDALLKSFPAIDLSLKNNEDQNAYMLATKAEFGNVKVIQSLLAQGKIDQNDAWEAILEAAMDDRTKIIQQIADAAHININDPWVAMMIVARSSDKTLIYETMEKMSDLNAAIFNRQDILGNTLLMLAIEDDDDELVESLLTLPNIDLKLKNNLGETASMIADLRNNENIMLLLAKASKTSTASAAGVDLNADLKNQHLDKPLLFRDITGEKNISKVSGVPDDNRNEENDKRPNPQ